MVSPTSAGRAGRACLSGGGSTPTGPPLSPHRPRWGSAGDEETHWCQKRGKGAGAGGAEGGSAAAFYGSFCRGLSAASLDDATTTASPRSDRLLVSLSEPNTPIRTTTTGVGLCRERLSLNSAALTLTPTASASSLLTRRLTAAGHSCVSPTGKACQPDDAERLARALLLASSPATAQLIHPLAEGEKIYDRFGWDRVLQEDGDGGKVVVCWRKDGGSPASGADGGKSPGSRGLVLKMRAKETLGSDEERYRAVQCGMMLLPSHPGVVNYHEALEDSKFLYTVMDYGVGGPLIQGLVNMYKSGVIPEAALREIMRQILRAVGHVHRNQMLHRDIKPDNVVLWSSAEESVGRSTRLMLIDFDYAEPKIGAMKPTPTGRFVGTPRFSAPEAFLGIYSRGSDLFSVGSILYLLVTGTLPYTDDMLRGLDDGGGCNEQENLQRVYQELKDTGIDWSCSSWNGKARCRDFCQALMRTDPRSRPANAEQALSHCWFEEE